MRRMINKLSTTDILFVNKGIRLCKILYTRITRVWWYWKIRKRDSINTTRNFLSWMTEYHKKSLASIIIPHWRQSWSYTKPLQGWRFWILYILILWTRYENILFYYITTKTYVNDTHINTYQECVGKI